MPQVIRAQQGDWARVREVRLRALTADPQAFGQDWSTESAYTEEQWRERIDEAAWFLAVKDDAPIGIIITRWEADSPENEREFQGMWVQKDFRKAGVARELADSVFTWAKEDGADTVTLYVSPENMPAMSLYEDLGFSDTGERWVVQADDPDTAWIKLARPL